jgi:hypothetical protein
MTVNGNLRYPSFRQLPGFLRQVGNVRQEKEKPTESEWWVGWRNSIAVGCRQFYRAFKAFKPSVGTGARLVPQSPDVFPGGLAGCVFLLNFVPYLPWSAVAQVLMSLGWSRGSWRGWPWDPCAPIKIRTRWQMSPGSRICQQ